MCLAARVSAIVERHELRSRSPRCQTAAWTSNRRRKVSSCASTIWSGTSSIGASRLNLAELALSSYTEIDTDNPNTVGDARTLTGN